MIPSPEQQLNFNRDVLQAVVAAIELTIDGKGCLNEVSLGDFCNAHDKALFKEMVMERGFVAGKSMAYKHPVEVSSSCPAALIQATRCARYAVPHG